MALGVSVSKVGGRVPRQPECPPDCCRTHSAAVLQQCHLLVWVRRTCHLTCLQRMKGPGSTLLLVQGAGVLHCFNWYTLAHTGASDASDAEPTECGIKMPPFQPEALKPVAVLEL